MAEAYFYGRGSGKDGITGSVAFTQMDRHYVRVDIDLKHVPKGIHGIHVHEKPINFQIKKDLCMQAGPHFNGSLPLWSVKNPKGTPHGSWRLNTDRHIGDLCNNILSMRKNGRVEMTYYDTLISLVPGYPNCIIGRSLIIHQNRDDEGIYSSYFDINDSKEIESKITGNAGHRIACANIYPI